MLLVSILCYTHMNAKPYSVMGYHPSTSLLVGLLEVYRSIACNMHISTPTGLLVGSSKVYRMQTPMLICSKMLYTSMKGRKMLSPFVMPLVTRMSPSRQVVARGVELVYPIADTPFLRSSSDVQAQPLDVPLRIHANGCSSGCFVARA